MANYFVVNTPSNLIVGVVTTSYSPEGSATKKFILANDKALDRYYKEMSKNPETLLDVGELMLKSPFIAEQVTRGRKASPTKSQRPRAEQGFNSSSMSRIELVQHWIKNHPLADEYALDAALGLGIVAARAYIHQYGYQ